MWAYAGISVVNAIPSGLGSTMAVDLKVRVEVLPGESGEHTQLTRAILDYFRKSYGVPELAIRVHSPIPPGGGLKSSSAVSVALIEAIAEKFGIGGVYPPALSAETSLIAGVSVTGAFDDAVAAYHGGVSFTNNLKREIIALRDPPLDLVVVINAIGGRRALDIDALRRHSEFFGEVFSIALRGDLLKAMTLNGMMIAKTLGYDIETVRRALSLGALAAGVSGNGPSLFAITREGDEGPLLDLFIAKGEGEVIVTRPAEVVRQRL